MQSKEYRTFRDLTGHPVLFHWRFYQGHTTTKILQMMLEISRMVGGDLVGPGASDDKPKEKWNAIAW